MAQYENGDLVTWGNLTRGGRIESTLIDGIGAYHQPNKSPAQKSQNGGLEITQIFNSNAAFCALREDGAAIVWGSIFHGGESRRSNEAAGTPVKGFTDADGNDIADILDPKDNGGIKTIAVVSASRSFAALRSDGSVVAWGGSDWGGDPTGLLNVSAQDSRTTLRALADKPDIAALLSGL